MTRFPDLKRIEAAIKNKDLNDLRWAIEYCRMRIGIATRKEHEQYWKGIRKKVQEALTNSD